MKAEQQSVDLLRQELEMKEQEVLALKEEKVYSTGEISSLASILSSFSFSFSFSEPNDE